MIKQSSLFTSIIRQDHYSSSQKVLFSQSQLTQIEEVFITKGWTKPKEKTEGKDDGDSPKKRRREKGYDKDGNWRKCFRCVSSCTHEKKKCDCLCSKHLLSMCPKSKKDGEVGAEAPKPRDEKITEATLGLYSQTLFGSLGLQSSSTFIMTEVQNDLAMDNTDDAVAAPELREEVTVDITLVEASIGTFTDGMALIDTACPHTVSWTNWLQKFISSMPASVKKGLISVNSIRVYKFGGGEIRKSLGKIKVPCYLGTDQNKELAAIEVEVVDADIPLLIGAASLKKARAIMDMGNMKLSLPAIPIPAISQKQEYR